MEMEKSATIIKGNSHSDDRGTLVFNNDYQATEVKRIYFIENKDTSFVRGWQGHQIEQRWFAAIQGSFKICIRAIDNWENPSKELPFEPFVIYATSFDVLHIPKGYITSIQSLEENSRLMAMSDYSLGTVSDEYRFDINYFNN
jgi:dTDP-4-dehydrorhamnose 3,5-epimerase-like enzyme